MVLQWKRKQAATSSRDTIAKWTSAVGYKVLHFNGNLVHCKQADLIRMGFTLVAARDSTGRSDNIWSAGLFLIIINIMKFFCEYFEAMDEETNKLITTIHSHFTLYDKKDQRYLSRHILYLKKRYAHLLHPF